MLIPLLGGNFYPTLALWSVRGSADSGGLGKNPTQNSATNGARAASVTMHANTMCYIATCSWLGP